MVSTSGRSWRTSCSGSCSSCHSSSTASVMPGVGGIARIVVPWRWAGGLLWIAVALLVTGMALVRVEVGGVRLGIDDSLVRSVLFWVHATSPLIAIWLFVLHRLVGPRLRWRVGMAWSGGGIALAAWLLVASVSPVEPPDGDVRPIAMAVSNNADFAPSLLETADDELVPASHLLGDEHCIELPRRCPCSVVGLGSRPELVQQSHLRLQRAKHSEGDGRSIRIRGDQPVLRRVS